jgi:phenylpyruvate tautomerase PptA (4-oxalocrotonate tautomerase family)
LGQPETQDNSLSREAKAKLSEMVTKALITAVDRNRHVITTTLDCDRNGDIGVQYGNGNMQREFD